MITRQISVQVAGEECGTRLDYWLAHRFNYHSRSRWQREIEKQTILLNHAASRPSRRLKQDDIVEYKPDNLTEPAVDWALETVFEDTDILAISKSGNLPMHPGGKYFRNTVWSKLKEELPEFWMINRLDRETSGILLIAKNHAAAVQLYQQFAAREVKKQYYVVVHGSPPEHLISQGRLVEDSASNVRKKRRLIRSDIAEDGGAQTEFTKISENAGISLLMATPTTGQLHQIRASLASAGFPIVGDKIYGLDENLFIKFIDGTLSDSDWHTLRMKRQALHAYQLAFRHPCTGRSQSVVAPLPQDFLDLLANCDFDSRKIA